MKSDRGTVDAVLPIILSALAGVLTLAGYVFTHFETADSALRTRDSIEKRLERIESKLDRLSERRQK